MGRIGRWVLGLAVLGLCIALPIACTQHHAERAPSAGTPLVRVRLLANVNTVTLRADVPPTVKTASENDPLRLNIASATAAAIELSPAGWKIGGVAVPGRGELTITPARDASVSINDKSYRGRYRFVPAGLSTFDVVNDVDVDSYLKGVLARELRRGWNEETYRAQAIVARTYALYEARSRGGKRAWDVNPDERSQVYGGYGDETDKSRAAADDTAGIVLAYGPEGQERIFKSYFSACCGGITQSAADAFGENYIDPLCDQDVHGLCNAAPRYNWGPVEISKAELVRRLRKYGERWGRGLADIRDVSRLDIQFTNRYGRPIRFVAIDAQGNRFSMTGEELRNAINAGASTSANPADKDAKLYSSFFKTVSEPGSDVIRFVEGHGNGHGVGMCQYCSEARAEAGVPHEDIVLAAFPRAKLVRAY